MQIIKLDGYNATVDNGKKLELGTFDSYGEEQLQIVKAQNWENLSVIATFNPPNKKPVQVVVDSVTGVIKVPKEATANLYGVGTIVFVGLADGVQRISADVEYIVRKHSNANGTEPAEPTPSVVEQILTEAQNANTNSAEAKNLATDAKDIAQSVRDDADNGKFNGKDGAKGDKGETGTTPQLKIGEDNLWQVSYDNGATWVSLGVKATGDAGKDGADGVTPHIGENGNWWVGETDTGVSAKGPKGDPGPQGPAGEIPEDYPQIREDVSQLKEDLDNLADDTGYPIIRGTTDGKLYYSIDTRIPVKNGHTYLFEVVNYSGNYSNGVQFRVVDAQGNASTVDTLHENSKSKYTADKDYNSFLINVLSTQKEIANFEVSIQDTGSLKIQLSAKMEEISNKSKKIEKEIQNNYILQSIYPHFHIGGTSSNNDYPSKATWEKYFESFKNAGLKGYILGFDIQPTTDSATSFLNGSITEDELKYFIYPDAEHYLEIISLGEKYGIELKCVKFHNQWMKDHYTKITFEKWFAIYRRLIISVLDDFKNRNIAQNCEWCAFLNNSATQGVNDAANVPNVRAFFSTLHSRYSNKYKLGIAGSVDDDTLNNYYGYFDCIMPFEYPPISSKGEMTTYEDSLTAWKSSMLSSQLIEYKTKYPNAEVIICETGCKNYYDSLIMPELDSYYTGDLISSGRPFSVFLYGLLEMAKRKEIDKVSSIWLYYTDDLYPDTQELIKKYIGGENE